MWCSNAKGTTHEKNIGFAGWIFSYSLGCHLWLYERTNVKKKREKGVLLQAERDTEDYYTIYNIVIYLLHKTNHRKYIHSFWELQQMFTYLKWRPTALPTPIKHCLRGETSTTNQTKPNNKIKIYTWLILSIDLSSPAPQLEAFGF